MIYLVTNSPALLPSPNYKLIGVEESLKILNNMRIIGLDTETSGLNPHLKDLLLVQMGNFDTQVVIDTRTVNILKYKELLEDEDKGFLLWNADFDLKFFYKYGIIVKNVYDGFLAELEELANAKILIYHVKAATPPPYRGERSLKGERSLGFNWATQFAASCLVVRDKSVIPLTAIRKV